jgi:predicted ArsR family transcriptional regulator
VRLTLVGLLRREGPLTATRAGDLIGESATTCSFHLRQLARYGLVEEAGGGRGRERPWRATAQFTNWPNVAAGPELAAASQLLEAVVAERYFESLLRWVDAKPDEPVAWQEASVFGDAVLYLTPEELAELGREVRGLADRWVERSARAELRPPSSRAVTFLQLAFPTPGPRAPHGG